MWQQLKWNFLHKWYTFSVWKKIEIISVVYFECKLLFVFSSCWMFIETHSISLYCTVLNHKQLVPKNWSDLVLCNMFLPSKKRCCQPSGAMNFKAVSQTRVSRNAFHLPLMTSCTYATTPISAVSFWQWRESCSAQWALTWDDPSHTASCDDTLGSVLFFTFKVFRACIISVEARRVLKTDIVI